MGAGSAVEAEGRGKQVSYDYANQQISKIYNLQDTSPSVLFRFDSSGHLTALFPTSSISFSASEITILSDGDFMIAENATSGAVVSNPQVSDPATRTWNYQSFGVWETGLDQNSRTFGIFSVGGPTKNSVLSLPGVDGATFTGKIVGSYVSPDGYGYTALAELQVDVAGQSLTFLTSNTLLSSDPYVNKVPFAPANPALALDLHGTLTYDSDTKIFSGSVATADNRLIGDSTGQFYGPNAEELGGVFFLRSVSDPLETYSGAYGAQQIAP